MWLVIPNLIRILVVAEAADVGFLVEQAAEVGQLAGVPAQGGGRRLRPRGGALRTRRRGTGARPCPLVSAPSSRPGSGGCGRHSAHQGCGAWRLRRRCKWGMPVFCRGGASTVGNLPGVAVDETRPAPWRPPQTARSPGNQPLPTYLASAAVAVNRPALLSCPAVVSR